MCAQLSRHVTPPVQLRIEKKKNATARVVRWVSGWLATTKLSLPEPLHTKKYQNWVLPFVGDNKLSKGIPGVTVPPDEIGQLHEPTASSDNCQALSRHIKGIQHADEAFQDSASLRTFVYTTFRKPNRKKTILVIKRRFPYSKLPTSPKKNRSSQQLL